VYGGNAAGGDSRGLGKMLGDTTVGSGGVRVLMGALTPQPTKIKAARFNKRAIRMRVFVFLFMDVT
jgi:hypothetical protein